MPKLIYSIFFFSLSICLKSQTDTNRIVLKVSEISSIQLKKVNPKSSTLQRELFLTSKDIAAFVNRWNSMSADTTRESPKPKYFFFVTLKNKDVKYFAVGGNQITDKRCFLSSPDTEKYFDKLWDSLTE